jgi:hypothetical protein
MEEDGFGLKELFADDDVECRAGKVIRELCKRRMQRRGEVLIDLGIDGVRCYVAKHITLTKLKQHFFAARLILESQSKDSTELDVYQQALCCELNRVQAAAFWSSMPKNRKNICKCHSEADDVMRRGKPRYDIGVPQQLFPVTHFPPYKFIGRKVYLYPREEEEQEIDDDEIGDDDSEDAKDEEPYVEGVRRSMEANQQNQFGNGAGKFKCVGFVHGMKRQSLNRLSPVTEHSPENEFLELLETYKKLDIENREVGWKQQCFEEKRSLFRVLKNSESGTCCVGGHCPDVTLKDKRSSRKKSKRQLWDIRNRLGQRGKSS